MKIKIGQEVPKFSLQDQDETVVTKESLLGKKYILFFYPKSIESSLINMNFNMTC